MVTVARSRRRTPPAHGLLVLLASAFLALTVLAALASALDEWA